MTDIDGIDIPRLPAAKSDYVAGAKIPVDLNKPRRGEEPDDSGFRR